MKLPESVMLTIRSAAGVVGVTGVTSLAALFARLVLPPPETVAAGGNVWADAPTNASADISAEEGHGVKHYWLCERCSLVFTLVHDEEYGVVLKVLWPEIKDAENQQAVSAA